MSLILSVMIILEIVVVVICFSRYALLPTLHLYLSYIIFSQIIFILFGQGLVSYEFVYNYSNGGFDRYYYNTLLTFSTMFFVCFAAHSNLVVRTSLQGRRVAFDRSTVGTISYVCIPVVSIFFLLFASTVKWDIIWFNNTYLAMTSPSIVAEGSQLDALINFLLPFGIISSALCAMNLVVGNFALTATFGLPATFVETFFIAGHGRGGAVVAVVFAFVLLIAGGKRFRTVAIGALLVSVFTIASALSGRSAGEHGLSTVPASVAATFAEGGSNLLSTILTNMSEGIFTVSESMQVDTSAPIWFKILNFSPTPAIIDGFDVLRDRYEVRLSSYAPISGLVEAYSFGWSYVVILIIFLVGSIRFAYAACRNNIVFNIISNMFIVVGVFLLGAYPIRNGAKMVWIGDVIAMSYYLIVRVARYK